MALRGRSPRGAVGLLLMLLAVSVGLASARRGRRGMGATIKQGPLVAVRWCSAEDCSCYAILSTCSVKNTRGSPSERPRQRSLSVQESKSGTKTPALGSTLIVVLHTTAFQKRRRIRQQLQRFTARMVPTFAVCRSTTEYSSSSSSPTSPQGLNYIYETIYEKLSSFCVLLASQIRNTTIDGLILARELVASETDANM